MFQQINIEKMNRLLSTLNFILFFVGYQLVTTIFLPDSSDIDGISRTVTVPYRAFVLLISIVVIYLNYNTSTKRYPISLFLYFFYWIILVIRMVYDIFIRSDVQLDNTSQLWLYVLGICIPAIHSIVVSYKMIDLEKSLFLIIGLIGLTLCISLLTNQALFLNTGDVDGRQDANLALNTISFGHLGVTAIILGFFVLIEYQLTLMKKILVFLLILIGAFCMLRAGSRGPVVALIVVGFFWSFSRGKNIVLNILKLIVLAVLLVVFFQYILNIVENISPVIVDRIKQSIYEGDTSDRNSLYVTAIQAFLDSPIIGKQFGLFFSDGTFSYSHNIILDAFMGMGVIGGFTLIYVLSSAIKSAFNAIKSNNINFWISLILVQLITANMLSGAIYYDQLLSALLAFQLVYFRYSNDNQIVERDLIN